MRILLTALLSLASTSAAHAAGAFASHPANSAAACARLCADDGLCIAWSFEDNACFMRATAPSSAHEGWTLSARAPASLRQAFVNALPAPVSAPIAEPAPPPVEPAAASYEEPSESLELLGGPEISANGEAQLRLGLRN